MARTVVPRKAAGWLGTLDRFSWEEWTPGDVSLRA